MNLPYLIGQLANTFSHRLPGELTYLRDSTIGYRDPLGYLANRFIEAPKILEGGSLERPITEPELSIHVLTGRESLLELFWSLGSFYKVSESVGELRIHNDGTLSPGDKGAIADKFPSAKIIDPEDSLRIARKKLADYREIVSFRNEYRGHALLKKLIDPYVVSEKRFLLILDTDVLWFKNPDFLREELRSKAPHSIMMREGSAPNFVYFRGGERSDFKKSFLNSGIVFYERGSMDLDILSDYLTGIDCSKESSFKYFLEQVGYSYCLRQLKALPEQRFSIELPVDSRTVARHYTHPRRALYYIEGIPILKSSLL